MNTSEGSLSQEEREALIRLLHDSGKEFLDLTATVTDSQWSLKRAPDSWSVQQAAEHLVLGEEAMLGRIMQALADPAVPDWQAEDARKTKFLSHVVPDRSRKAIAPAPLEPHHPVEPRGNSGSLPKGPRPNPEIRGRSRPSRQNPCIRTSLSRFQYAQ